MTVFAAEGDAGGIGEASCVEIADFEAPAGPCWDSRVDCSKFSRGSPPPADTAVGGSLPPSLWPGTSLPWPSPALSGGVELMSRSARLVRVDMGPNTPACVLSLAVACVRLFAAPVEAGYVTSSALLSRPPSHPCAEGNAR